MAERTARRFMDVAVRFGEIPQLRNLVSNPPSSTPWPLLQRQTLQSGLLGEELVANWPQVESGKTRELVAHLRALAIPHVREMVELFEAEVTAFEEHSGGVPDGDTPPTCVYQR